MAERIDIELVDKIAPSISRNLVLIANKAREADTAISKLHLALDQTKSINALAKLTSAQARATTASAKLAAAQSKITVNNSKLAISNAKVAVSEQRKATELERTRAASARAEAAILRLNNAQAKATKANNTTTLSLKGMIGGLTAAYTSARSLLVVIGMADEYRNLENRLKATGLEGQALAGVYKQLQDSANNTRSSLSGTVELYSRLAVSSKELGVSQNELIQFTTSLNQAILLSGANATEAQAGLIQLSQGMASGTLRGDELRSVLEQLPAVADVISNHLGVTRGQLRQLGSEGKITAKDILAAFKEAGPELGQRFAGQASTASQALTVLKNKVMTLIGENGSGGLTQLVGGLNQLTAILDNAGGATKALAFVFETTGKVIRTALLLISRGVDTLRLKFNILATGVVHTLTLVVGMAAKVGEAMALLLPEDMANTITSRFAVIKESIKGMAEGLEKDRIAMIRNEIARAKQLKEIWAPTTVGQDSTLTPTKWNKATPDIRPRKKGGRANLTPATFSITYTPWKISDAFEDINKELDEMYSTLGLTDNQLEIHNKMLDYAARVKSTKGSDLDLAIMRERLELYQEQSQALARQKAILDSVQGANFAQKMSDLNTLSARGGITANQRQDYLISQNQDLFEGTQEAIDANVRAYSEMYSQIDAMRRSYDISEQTASQQRQKVWLMENEWKIRTVSDTLGGLAALQESTNRHIGAVGKAFAVAQASIDGVLAVQKALASAPPPYNYALAAGVGTTAAVNVAKIQGLPGFEVGGYTGDGMPSSVAGIVHKGEYVVDANSVQRIGVDNLDNLRNGGAAGNNGGIRIVNVVSPEVVAEYLSSSEGERVILNHIKNNPEVVKFAVQ